MAAIEVYVDESGTHAGSPVTCVAAYVLITPQCRKLDRAWRNALGVAGVPYFRMSSCAHGTDVFADLRATERDALARRLIGLIRQRIEFGCAAFIPEAEFLHRTGPKWREAYGNVYTWCIQLALGMIGAWQERSGNPGPIAYIFEAGHRHAHEVDRLMRDVANNPETRAIWRYASHAFVTKETAPALQAADILAWQSNKYYRSRILEGGVRPMRRDFAALLKEQQHRYRFWSTDGDGLKSMIDSMKALD